MRLEKGGGGEKVGKGKAKRESDGECVSLSPDHSHQPNPVTHSERSLPPGSELFLLCALVPLGLREYSAVGNEHNWTSAEFLLQLSH